MKTNTKGFFVDQDGDVIDVDSLQDGRYDFEYMGRWTRIRLLGVPELNGEQLVIDQFVHYPTRESLEAAIGPFEVAQ